MKTPPLPHYWHAPKGTYGVALHEGHYRQLVFAHVSPPPAQPQQVEASLIRMGFPKRKLDDFPSFCSW
jgi:transcription initiation factor TFIIH subunit 2